MVILTPTVVSDPVGGFLIGSNLRFFILQTAARVQNHWQGVAIIIQTVVSNPVGGFLIGTYLQSFILQTAARVNNRWQGIYARFNMLLFFWQ